MQNEQTTYKEYYISYLHVAENGISRDFLNKFTYGECLIDDSGHKTSEYSTDKVLKFGRKTQFQIYFKEIYYRLKMTNRMMQLINLKEKLVQLVGDFGFDTSLDDLVSELNKLDDEDVISVTGVSLERLTNGLRLFDNNNIEFLMTIQPSLIEEFIVDKKTGIYQRSDKNVKKGNKNDTIK